ncbi:metallophosphoesterase [Candidatus Woesearchaeota archaeon]|nr:metallophosphoesterase [Candidatus Woesearchaeota archaeon]
MKVLAFADLHSHLASLKKLEQKVRNSKPDIILCAGDFTVFQSHVEDIMKRLNRLGKVYIIHGNHEIESKIRALCRRYKNLEFVHKKIVKIGDYLLVAYGGGGFATKDKEFEQFIKKNAKKLKGKIILMTHAPPYGTKLDYIDYMGDHVGCKSYTDFIKKYQPVLAISGHIHETAGKKDKIKNSELIHPEPKGVIIKL